MYPGLTHGLFRGRRTQELSYLRVVRSDDTGNELVINGIGVKY